MELILNYLKRQKFKNDILFRTNVMSIFKNFIRFNFE